MKTTLLLLSLAFPVLSNAAQISENFSTIEQKATVTGVWNLSLGRLTPRFRVVNYGGGASSSDFTVGDGSDGVFDISTYANFSVGGNLAGNIIRLDQTRFPQLNVTSFHLEDGWFLEPSANLPLEIYSHSDVIIDGEIWCHGRNGTSAGAAGTGRCGGASGGAGGASGVAGSPGGNIPAGPTGGGGGNAGTGGGGGGGYGVAPLAPPSAGGGGGGAAGVNDVDHAFVAILGAAGGGGGGGAGGNFGGGGGGGAGTVIIHAARDVEFGVNGTIRAYGGQGGAGTGASGSGGSGGSGSVKIFSGRDITGVPADPTLEIDAAQTVGVVGGGASGGAGGFGRTWLTLPGIGFGNFQDIDYDPTEDFSHALGEVQYFVGTDTFETNTFEIRNSDPSYLSVVSSPVDAGITFLVKASNDNFVSDDSGWVAVTDPSLADRRYFKLQISLNNPSPTTPLTVDSVTLNYDGHMQNEFNFTGAGCGRVAGSSGGTGLWLVIPFLLLLQVRRTFLIVGASIFSAVLFMTVPVANAAPTCSESTVAKQCQELKATSKSELTFESGRIPNPFHENAERDEEARKAVAHIDISKQKARVGKIAAQVKESLLKIILKGRSFEQLTKEEKDTYRRMETLSFFHGDDPKISNSSTCAGNALNAYYEPNGHYMALCSAFYQYPDSTLIYALGHEMGHAIGPCMSTFYLSEKKIADGAWDRFADREMQLVSGFSHIAVPVKGAKYPFRTLRECLINESQIQAMPEDERKLLTAEIVEDQVLHKVNPEEILEDITNSHCPFYFYQTVSHIEESSADSFGSAVMIDLMKDKKLARAEAIMAIGDVRQMCIEVEVAKPARTNYHKNRAYPPVIDRFLKILAQAPAISSALGCAPDSNYQCATKSLLSTPSSVMRQSPAGKGASQ